jgi:adenylosuccinate synthase
MSSQPTKKTTRPDSYAICGGAYGDEGKGRIVDMLVHDLAKKGSVVVYRDNGANAGHTVEFPNGQRVAFHQLPSGVFIKGATVVLGKEMVIHPGDLLAELQEIKSIKVTKDRSDLMIDEMAILSLDTHRAYEAVLKDWQSGGKGSTGRGISPAYADVLLRHPLRMRDIVKFDQKKIEQHYAMYAALIKGLGQSLARVKVPTLVGTMIAVGSKAKFVERLQAQAKSLKSLTHDLQGWLSDMWQDHSCGFVFEKAQAVGLDYRWGVYPDVTASDTTFSGIFSATEGTIDPDDIGVKAGVIKATYMSSVGTRRLPTLMTEQLADRIREDAHEYGATTKRPRDIAYLDIPALKFFAQVGKMNALMLTHMDISYLDHPIKVCVEYRMGKEEVEYRPDQTYLDKVKPVYKELAPWDAKALRKAKTYKELPMEARNYLKFIETALGIPVTLITTGPQREQSLWIVK